MPTSGTYRTRNDATRFAGLDAEALRKPDKLAPTRSFCLTPLGQALAESCVLLAFKLARPWQLRWPGLTDDIEGEALLALTYAAAHFDPNAGIVFSTYAGETVKGRIKTAIYRRGPAGYRLRAGETPVVDWPTFDQGMPVDIEDKETPDPVATLEAKETDEIVGTLMGRIEPRLAEVLRQRHLEGKTLQEVGDKMGLTRERIRQLEVRALMKIREGVIAG